MVPKFVDLLFLHKHRILENNNLIFDYSLNIAEWFVMYPFTIYQFMELQVKLDFHIMTEFFACPNSLSIK